MTEKELINKAVAQIVDDKGADAKKILTKIASDKISNHINKKVKELEKTVVNSLK